MVQNVGQFRNIFILVHDLIISFLSVQKKFSNGADFCWSWAVVVFLGQM